VVPNFTDGGAKIATSLWVKSDEKLSDAYVKEIKSRLETSVQSRRVLDTDEINKWVETRTYGAIPRLITSPIPESTAIAIANCLVFESEWSTKFHVTRNARFLQSKSKFSQVRMMCSLVTDDCNIASDVQHLDLPTVDVLRKPFIAQNWSLVFVRPAPETITPDQTRSILDSMTRFCDIAVADTERDELYIEIPKFKLEISTDGQHIKRAMKSANMTRIFDSENSDWVGFQDPSHKKGIYVSDIFHKVVLDVSEEKVKIAAATALIMKASMAAPPPSKPKPKLRFVLDRPFAMALCWKTTPCVIAWISNPAPQ
jgi:serpin B